MSDSSSVNDILKVNNRIFFNAPINENSITFLAGEITELDYKIQKEIKEKKNPEHKRMELFINSPGGFIAESNFIYDYIKGTIKTEVVTVATGSVASAAVSILLAGDKRYITRNGLILIHQISWSLSGNHSYISDNKENMDIIADNILSLYSKETKLSKSQLRSHMMNEKYFTAKQSIDYGFVQGYWKG